MNPMEDRDRLEITRPVEAVSGISRCHLLVIGGGPAGLVAAVGAAGLGAQVVLAEERLLGGDCLHTGCVPSKALLHVARQQAGPVSVVEAFQHVRDRRASMAVADQVERFSGMGIEVLGGRAEFTGPDTARVGNRDVHFRKAVIATGSRPYTPSIPGLDRVPFLTTDSVWQVNRDPGRVLVLGGGPVGCELSQALARLGCQVSLVQSRGRLLPRDDPESSSVMAQALVASGVSVNLATTVMAFGRDHDGAILASTTSGPLRCDTILLAAGRRANIDELGLQCAGISTMADGPQVSGADGIRVDGYLRTSNDRVFAVGDCVAGAPRFTHAADAMARLAVRNALIATQWPFGLLLGAAWAPHRVPWCTWTDPEVAGVGEINPPGATLHRIDMEANDRHVLEEAGPGWLKVWTDRSGKIVGSSMCCRGAGELIGVVALAMREGWSLKKLSGWVVPYPSRNQVLSRAGDAAARQTLTPAVSGWLRWWLGKI